MQASQLTQPEVAVAIQCLLQRQAADDAAAAKKKQEEDMDKRCKLAAKEAVEEMKTQMQAMEEKIGRLEAEVQKIRKRPREIDVIESEGEEPEEEEEDGQSKAKKRNKKKMMLAKNERPENEDTESIFQDEDNGEADARQFRHKHMHEVRWLKSAEDFKEWVRLRLKEQSARATSFLLDWANSRGIDVKGAKKQATIVSRMAAEFEKYGV
jgi:hypothetical protein